MIAVEFTFSVAVGYILGLMIIFVLARICLKPIKFIIRIILNSVVGAVLLFLINTVGGFFGIHIGINAVTAVAVGLLGLPAVILMLILQIFF